jgi:hypothetical protein
LDIEKVIQRTITPFSGNFYDSNGKLRNIDGQLVTGDGFKNPNTQINGDYYDHEGNIRNIKELLDSFRSGGISIPGNSVLYGNDENGDITTYPLYPPEIYSSLWIDKNTKDVFVEIRSNPLLVLDATKVDVKAIKADKNDKEEIVFTFVEVQSGSYMWKSAEDNDYYMGNSWNLVVIEKGKIVPIYVSSLNFTGSGGGSSLPNGGTIGQVLAKKSNSDGDVLWTDDKQANVDLITLTQAEYNALPQADKDDPTKYYFITDGVANFVLENQGLLNAGKVLGVNSEGIVVPINKHEIYPDGGSDGQLLSRNHSLSGKVEWVDPPSNIRTNTAMFYLESGEKEYIINHDLESYDVICKVWQSIYDEDIQEYVIREVLANIEIIDDYNIKVIFATSIDPDDYDSYEFKVTIIAF